MGRPLTCLSSVKPSAAGGHHACVIGPERFDPLHDEIVIPLGWLLDDEGSQSENSLCPAKRRHRRMSKTLSGEVRNRKDNGSYCMSCSSIDVAMPGPGGDKSFLYMFLKDQPIWQSLRFWNAAFFDAVQCERSRRPMPTNSAANDTMTDDRNFQENITFGQLGTFACNMRAFGLSRELCMEFLRKQSTIANLSEDQVKLLRDNVDKMKDT
ncbi:hypothetical protein C0Q70_19456 [Pomacea canaliculata]|uniref:SBF1/SBF2 domain-containing protein n=1 Tax=Pomacea canaliculata TaxID=400727 RepID=A0A2T7NJE1_POMCA|nr:hypothetical protein C0Q70_19456 [Pomacea canaliculata]